MIRDGEHDSVSKMKAAEEALEAKQKVSILIVLSFHSQLSVTR